MKTIDDNCTLFETWAEMERSMERDRYCTDCRYFTGGNLMCELRSDCDENNSLWEPKLDENPPLENPGKPDDLDKSTPRKVNKVDRQLANQCLGGENKTQKLIREVCSELADFLIKKNEAYGNSALEPCRIFAKADALEQINVRIDDKLNRMIQGSGYPGDNDERDLVGYFVLKWVAQKIAALEK
jgi:hypothetical protein